jgi:hypothetical protein
MEDAVYLKNGDIIRGIIIEQVPNQSIKIQTRDRNVYVFKLNDIEKLTKENVFSTKTIDSTKIAPFNKDHFVYFTELNYCSGAGNYTIMSNENNSYGLRQNIDYQFNDLLSLGLGIGIDKYRNMTLMPISFNTKFAILKKYIGPFIAANIGYGFSLHNTAGLRSKGGLFVNPQIGMKSPISKHCSLIYNIGYKMQMYNGFSYYQNYIYYGNWKNFYFHFLTIGIGIEFY